ncbi:MAG: hypothetical protein AAF492_09970, partial [Verrucomicrobiota bacterium]
PEMEAFMSYYRTTGPALMYRKGLKFERQPRPSMRYPYRAQQRIVHSLRVQVYAEDQTEGMALATRSHGKNGVVRGLHGSLITGKYPLRERSYWGAVEGRAAGACSEVAADMVVKTTLPNELVGLDLAKDFGYTRIQARGILQVKGDDIILVDLAGTQEWILLGDANAMKWARKKAKRTREPVDIGGLESPIEFRLYETEGSRRILAMRSD